MAKSPAHKFGQDLGKLLEDVVLYKILKPRLEAFAQAQNLRQLPTRLSNLVSSIKIRLPESCKK